jgi:hypothetical protein
MFGEQIAANFDKITALMLAFVVFFSLLCGLEDKKQ